ncbi:MAG: aa3-type cytochrome c oxidase subunit IV [Pseudomonadota bacterium]
MADHDHKHGEMDISTQEEMFAKVINVTVWAVGLILLALVLLYLING